AMLTSAAIIIGVASLLSLLIALILASHIKKLKSREPIFEMLAPSSKLLTFSDSNELATNIDTSHPVLFCALESEKDSRIIQKYLDQFEKDLSAQGALIVQRLDHSLLILFPAGSKTALAAALALNKKMHRTNKALLARKRSAIQLSCGMHVGKANLATT